MVSRKAKDNSFNNTLHKSNTTLTPDDGKKEASLTGWEMPDNSVFNTTPGKGGTDTENEEKGSFIDVQAERAEKAKLRQERRVVRKLKLSQINPLKGENRDEKVNDVKYTNAMIITEFKKHPAIMARLKAEKVAGITSMNKLNLEEKFARYFKISAREYFNTGYHQQEKTV